MDVRWPKKNNTAAAVASPRARGNHCSPSWPSADVCPSGTSAESVGDERSLAMRWMGWASALLSVYALACPAAGFEPGCGAGCGTVHRAYGAGACAAPAYGWEQGCCEHPPSCCDNAWAGYCEEKARWEAYWRQVCSRHTAACYPRPATVIYRQPTPATHLETPQEQEFVAPGVPRPAQPAAPTIAPSVPRRPSPASPRPRHPRSSRFPNPPFPRRRGTGDCRSSGRRSRRPFAGISRKSASAARRFGRSREYQVAGRAGHRGVPFQDRDHGTTTDRRTMIFFARGFRRSTPRDGVGLTATKRP